MMSEGLFPLGQIVATPGAIAVMEALDPDGDHSRYAARLLARHHSGDWGELEQQDQEQNQIALVNRGRIFSMYGTNGDKLYVITEADRSSTTILTPNEY
jgi:hypothetical protein